MAQTRGERNCNPCNIRLGTDWEGCVPADYQTDKSFIQFTDVKYGIRAAAVILLNYQKIHKLDTIRQMIFRWAPPVENEAEAYSNDVAKDCGVNANEVYSLTYSHNLFNIVKAIIKHENGSQPYSDDIIANGIELALT